MPSGMRRTRVFGLVKGLDGARVLRSGRRLWPESGEVKLKKSKDASDWYPVIDSRGNGGGSGQVRLHGKWTQVRNVKPKRVVVVNIREEEDACVVKVPEPLKVLPRIGSDGESGDVDRMFGKVYSRKRKRGRPENGYGFDEMEGDNAISGDRMFGLRFIRRQRSRKTDITHWEPTASGRSTKLHFHRPSVSPPLPRDRVLTIFAGSSINNGCFSDFIQSVLRHLNSPELNVAKLSSFLLSNTINGVFASTGMRFLQGYPPTGSSGMCVIFGSRQCIPMFHLDFSAVPFPFMYLHSKMFLRQTRIQARLVYNNEQLDVDMSSDSEEDSMVEEQHVSNPPVRSSLDCKTVAFGVDHTNTRSNSQLSVRASRLGSRALQYRNGFSSRGIRKRRSSLRMRRPRSHSLAAMQKTVGIFGIDDMKRSVSFPSVASCNRHKNSALRDSSGRVSSTALGSAMDVDSSCCNANILIVEADRCMREEGANIVLEFSASCEWLLAVKKNGSTRYTHKAETVMKPAYCNRFTHAILWSADNGWKLEFPNRRDWLIFKDLYKECSDRNIPCFTAKAIPVPRVSEVPDYVDSSCTYFKRPDTYISVNDDEVCRARAKSTANYDMDSEDEEWLSKFNDKLIATDKQHECLSGDSFELMIDAFEKELFCNPDAFSDEKAPTDMFMLLGSRSTVESLFTYWTRKRRQRKSCLIRVFQAHQSKRKPPVVPKPIMRRKRSIKRQPSQSGSGRATQSSILKAIVSRRDAVEEQNAVQKYEEAKAAAERCMESAVSKRQRAQLLLENADLAAYKAVVALRIAEAIQASELPEAAAATAAAACFLE
ncbi:uncharacterized protein LOC111808903 isoform X1 [Cucurbita pepo subsp. pepo]|uniref:uncharacterized protein LOC111808903 isoform X1 n=1 Tax=Cucurbita pepo subsp. pepo TaxID=3664 RepID=UPI000C9D6261|nr:uncharacterized protein LOC111808903 isoform X1 [Cucurbita pepo subsp. pepo]